MFFSIETTISHIPVSTHSLGYVGSGGALTLHPPTNRPRDIPTHTICPPNIFCPLWQFSTATLRPSDIFLLWQSDSVTIFYCDMWHFSTVTFRLWQFSTVTFHLKVDRFGIRPPQKVNILSHCDIPTHFNFGQLMAVTFCPLWMSISPVNTLSKLLPILTDDDLVTLSL